MPFLGLERSYRSLSASSKVGMDEVVFSIMAKADSIAT